MSGGPGFRPPESYLHGSVVVVPARVAAWLERAAGLRRVRTAARGMDPEVDAVLVALAYGAARWRSSVTGTGRAVAEEHEAVSETQVTTSVAAVSLGIGERAVRQAIQRGRLPAVQVAGRWVIEREDIEHYRQARQAG